MARHCFVCGHDFDEILPAEKLLIGWQKVVYVHPDDCKAKLEDEVRRWIEQWEKDHPIRQEGEGTK
jgi:hypothetical protein